MNPVRSSSEPFRLSPLLPVLWLGVLMCTPTARSELYAQKKSASPNGATVFAINYPSTDGYTKGSAQGCFLHRKSKERIGAFFYLPGTDAETDHPGTYPFDNYNVFDYVWSADSTRVAIVHNFRHFGEIYPIRRRGASFQLLQMPDLEAPLQKRLAGVLQQSIHTSVTANRWDRKHRLVATIAREAQVTNAGDQEKDWQEYSLQFTISFAPDGKPTVKAAKFRIKK